MRLSLDEEEGGGGGRGQASLFKLGGNLLTAFFRQHLYLVEGRKCAVHERCDSTAID